MMNRALMNTTLSLVILLSGTEFTYGQTNSADARVIEMTNEATYNPAMLVIHQGEQIVWHNKSNGIQTITVKTRKENQKILASAPADAEPFSSGAIKPGETFSYTFYMSGTYELVSLTNPENGSSIRIVVNE